MTMTDGTLLIVQHGRNRGRLHGFRQHILDHIAGDWPALARRIRVHETGATAPDLEGVRAVMFWLADPLRELYPDCWAEAMAIAAEARRRGGRVVNDPAALSSTIKSAQARTWQAAGIPCAAAEPFADASGLAAAVTRVGLPAIVRTDLHHAQEATFLCRTAEDVARLPADGRLYPGVALALVDTRAGYEQERPGTIWARSWHKKRIHIFGDIAVPNHCLFAPTPVVGLHQSAFWRYKGKKGKVLEPLAWLRRWDREAIMVDRVYADAAPERPELFIRATRALGLDFVAVDYSTLADGSVILWEANPYFTMPVGQKGPGGRLRRLGPRVKRLCDGMARYFEELVDGEQ